MTPKAKAHEGFALLKLAIRELLESEQEGLTTRRSQNASNCGPRTVRERRTT